MKPRILANPAAPDRARMSQPPQTAATAPTMARMESMEQLMFAHADTTRKNKRG